MYVCGLPAVQVMYTTACSTALSFLGAVFSGQLWPSLTFIIRNPDALGVILALSASSAAVQLVISYTIKRYGALVFATIMTTRQFFAILLSSIVFWTPLKSQQW
jgi:solute carrier family 35 (adenosine 3'-phospho 5'-phosphosulfate transporter), member B2